MASTSAVVIRVDNRTLYTRYTAVTVHSKTGITVVTRPPDTARGAYKKALSTYLQRPTLRPPPPLFVGFARTTFITIYTRRGRALARASVRHAR